MCGTTGVLSRRVCTVMCCDVCYNCCTITMRLHHNLMCAMTVVLSQCVIMCCMCYIVNKYQERLNQLLIPPNYMFYVKFHVPC